MGRKMDRSGGAARPAYARRASRQRGERTRQKIIAAAQRVIARDGVRAASHRSVAQEAGVNLSLTTYYFVDLYELIAAAFRTFSDGGNSQLRERWERGFRYLDKLGPVSSLGTEARERVRDYALKQICDHMRVKVTQESVWLAIEQQFFFAALNDRRLMEMASAHRARLLAPLIELFQYFESPQPAIDAELLFGTIIRLEYEALLHDTHEVHFRRARREVKRLLDLMFGLTQPSPER
jgi:DNA-binding transcriptional regulator YbjK